MNVWGHDLGVLNGPVLLFGGPYSNLEATEALLAEAARLNIPASNMICTGDIVAYCADAEATAAAIRATGMPVVMGNCEESLAEGAADCGCGFEEGTACDLLSVAWYAHADRNMSAGMRTWMGTLPRGLRFTVNGITLAVVHGSASSINRFVFASTPEEEKTAEIALTGCDGIIGGHCGLPFTQLIGNMLWHNSGAIGLPANDGTPRVWYALLHAEGDGIAIEHRALDYDHQSAAAKMRAAGLPDGYQNALIDGLWPSCDVLPPDELTARGAPLALDGARYTFSPQRQVAAAQ